MMLLSGIATSATPVKSVEYCPRIQIGGNSPESLLFQNGAVQLTSRFAMLREEENAMLGWCPPDQKLGRAN
jgi:hypothetical protein